MKKKRFAAAMLAASLAVSSFAAFASTGKGSQEYTDVDAGVFYDEATYYLNYEGIMTGYKGAQEGMFGSTDGITRGQVVTTLWRLVGEPASQQEITYPDVVEKTTAYYYAPIKWATEQGIIKGYDDGTFRPNRICSRREIAKMVTEFADIYGYDDLDSDDVRNFDMSQYTDIDDAGWAYEEGYVQWMAYHQIMSGKDATTLAPREIATRGQWAVILTRLITEVNAPATQVVMKNDPTDINVMMSQDPILDIQQTQTTIDEYNEYGYTYKSADESIVTVDANGVMTGVGAPGSQTTVRIKSKLSAESKVVKVQVGYGAATKLEYIKDDKEDQTVYLESTSRWSSTADLIADIETVYGTYDKYRDLVFSFVAKDGDSNNTYDCKYDSGSGKVVIMCGEEDVTNTFNVDEERTFDRITLTFPDGYNIAKMLTDLADIADLAGKAFSGVFTYRDTTVTEISIADDFYVQATINGQTYYFFNIGDNIYAQGNNHAADVTEYIAIKQWTDVDVISATLVAEPN